MDNYKIQVNNSTFDHGSSVVKEVYGGVATSQDVAILQELQKIQNQLKDTEPMIVDALSNLEQAIRNQDKPSISKFVRQLSSGVSASFLANLASGSLLSFLGIG